MPLLKRGAPLVLLAAVAGVFGPSVDASTANIPLTVTIVGKGTVRLGGGRQVSCGIYVGRPCTQRFQVKAATGIALRATPVGGWKFSKWTGACTATAVSCRVTVNRPTHVTATFLAPGTTANPIPLGTTTDIDDLGGSVGWSLKVDSVVADATSQILAIGKNATCCQPRPGAQDFLIVISATAHGSALGLGSLLANLYAKTGNSNSTYSIYTQGACGTLPPPHLWDQATFSPRDPTDFVVNDGQTVTGTICFQVDNDDAKTLRLFTEPPLLYPDGVTDPSPDAHARWFSLR